jgi:ammonia channel protein AmtB
VLWGYPSSPDDSFAAINPLGQFAGAIVMFFVLGFVPGWVIAKILNAAGMLRIPIEIELMGLDAAAVENEAADEAAIIQAEKDAISKL